MALLILLFEDINPTLKCFDHTLELSSDVVLMARGIRAVVWHTVFLVAVQVGFLSEVVFAIFTLVRTLFLMSLDDLVYYV